MTLCACGCGGELNPIPQKKNRGPRKFLHGHNMSCPEYKWIRDMGHAAIPRGEQHHLWKGGISTESRRKRKHESCDRCGFVPEDSCQLDLHIHDSPDAETLCANCHRLCTLYEKRGGPMNVSWVVSAPRGGEVSGKLTAV